MTFEKRRYEAAKYLLLKDKELSELSLDCFEDEKIFFNRLCWLISLLQIFRSAAPSSSSLRN